METDLRNLIADSQFQAYHRELVEPREFNTFDVLRYSGYEIRHSNVLAWLLRPADTHGIGPRFLKWFVNHVTSRFAAADRQRLPETSFEAGNVEVWRERDYVDITIFFKKDKCLIAIENKTEPAHPQHLDQVMGYAETLQEKHKDHAVRSVLLTTSPDGSVNFRGIAHVGWDSVCEAIDSVLAGGAFPSPNVQAFIRQYLDMVERWFRPGGEGFKAMLDDYRPLLERLANDREEGAGKTAEVLPEDLSEYRSTVCRLVNDFRQEHLRLSSAVRSFLKRKGFQTWGRGGFLYFRNLATDKTRESLNLPWWQGRWTMGFAPRWVNLSLEFGLGKGTRPVVDRIARFMKDNPIDTSPEGRAKYPVKHRSGHLIAYAHTLVTDEELMATPAAEIENVALEKMTAFLDLDFTRVETYLKCLAFDPAVPE